MRPVLDKLYDTGIQQPVNIQIINYYYANHKPGNRRSH